MTQTVTVDVAGRSHIGLVRHRNEDALYVGAYLAAVADGLGGHVSGDVASAVAIQALRELDHSSEPAALPSALARGVDAANTALRKRIATDPELRGMGSTLVALMWAGSQVALAHIGDSRAYRLRDGRMVQMTEDHSFEHLIAAAARVPTLPQRMSRFVDGQSGGRPADITTHDLRPGDRWLLCSDGLSSFVAHEAIQSTLSADVSADETTDRLVALAIEAGGQDNVTVVMIDVRNTAKVEDNR